MKQSRFTEEQIIKILKEGEVGGQIKELCRRYGISDACYYKWKSQYAGLTVPEVKRLKALEMENSKLKRLVAEQALDIVGLKDVLSKKW